MHTNRDWTILLIGGPSGTGKSSLAYGLARHFGVSVLEVDTIEAAIKAVTTAKTLPAMHYWDTGVDWRNIGVEGNVQWLTEVSAEMAAPCRAVVERSLEDDVPLIIEGDFLSPDFAASFEDPRVRALFLYEPDKEQIVQNYLAREGGEPQHYRAEISVAYGGHLASRCRKLGLPLIESRPWDTAVDRAIRNLT